MTVNRRQFLVGAANLSLALTGPVLGSGAVFGGHAPAPVPDPERMTGQQAGSDLLTIFLCGDVMTGRGIDQILPHPSDPQLFERYVRTAGTYVRLAEAKNGRIPRRVAADYIWGDALEELRRVEPDVRIINLETSVTSSDSQWRGKGIHYRMHPQNVSCLTAAGIDCCVLANNHVLDWGTEGLTETLDTLEAAGIETAGAGADREEANEPAVFECGPDRRVIVFAFGVQSSGIPNTWAATTDRPGVSFLPDLARNRVKGIAERVRAVKRRGDVVVGSIHWGGNWGYEVARDQREFAYRLIEEAGVDVIHGHSSHHPMGVEVYRDRPVLYGSGDFINDYEGIQGHEEFRGDLVLMYFLDMDPSDGRLVHLHVVPMQIRRFRLNRASAADATWMRELLNREGKPLGTRVELDPDGALTLQWT